MKRSSVRDPAPRVSLWLGTSAGDAFENVVLPWFRETTGTWERPALTAAVFADRSDALFHRSLLLNRGVSLLGVQFLSPARLRERILRDSASRLPSDEHLRLLMSAAAEEVAGQHEGANTDNDRAICAAAGSVARAPDHLLHAIGKLGAAGWNFEDAGPLLLQPIADKFRQLVQGCGFQLISDADRSALDRISQSRAVFADLLLCGFDGSHWPLWPLLRSAAMSSEQATVVLRDPRDEARNLDEAWVGTWEETFGAVQPIDPCAETAAQPAETLFLVGRDTTEQANAVTRLCEAFLAADLNARIGVLFPGPGPLPRIVGSLLGKAGILHNDGIAHNAPGPFEVGAWQPWLELQANPRLAILLRFLRAHRGASQWFDGMTPEAVEKVFRSAFGDLLIDDLSMLREFCGRKTDHADSIRVAAGIGRIQFLPERATLPNFLVQTKTIFQQLGWEDRWIEVRRLSNGWSEAIEIAVGRDAYLRWLDEITSTVTRIRDEPGSHPYSRVHLLSYRSAEKQEWSHLILAGMNEGRWPPADAELDYLDDSALENLNANVRKLNRRSHRRGSQGEGHSVVAEGTTWCLGSSERRQIALRQLENSIEGTSAQIAVTANLLEESAPSRSANPSDFFTRLYFRARGKAVSQATMDRLHAQTHSWLAGSERKAEAVPSGLRQTRIAYDARRQDDCPFGEYEFALRIPRAAPVTLAATALERALTSPALVWMNAYLGVSPEDEDIQAWSLATGKWAHRWLARIVQAESRDQFGTLLPSNEIQPAVRKDAERLRLEVEHLLAECGRDVPDWWISGWRHAAYVADRLAGKVAGVTEWPYAAAEWRLPSPQLLEIAGDAQLAFSGRIDLILARGPRTGAMRDYKEVWVIDYKTGPRNALRPDNCKSDGDLCEKFGRKLRRGEGIQLSLYALALRKGESPSIRLSLLSPKLSLNEPQLTVECVAAQSNFWRALSRMQTTGVFGMHGPIRSEFTFAGTYPLATLAIASEILARKWALTHPAFVDPALED